MSDFKTVPPSNVSNSFAPYSSKYLPDDADSNLPKYSTKSGNIGPPGQKAEAIKMKRKQHYLNQPVVPINYERNPQLWSATTMTSLPSANPQTLIFGIKGFADFSQQDSDDLQFMSRPDRYTFIKRVYGLLSFQMILTSAVIIMMCNIMVLKNWLLTQGCLVWIFSIIAIMLLLVIGICTISRRKFPTDILILEAFTLTMSIILGMVSVLRHTQLIPLSVILITCIVVVTFVFGYQNKYDLTYLSGSIIVASVIIFGFFFAVFYLKYKLLSVIYCSMGIFLYSVVLLIETQLILEGHHIYIISQNESVFVTLNIYLNAIHSIIVLLAVLCNLTYGIN